MENVLLAIAKLGDAEISLPLGLVSKVATVSYQDMADIEDVAGGRGPIIKNKLVVGVVVDSGATDKQIEAASKLLPEALRPGGVFALTSKGVKSAALSEWVEGRVELAVKESASALFKSEQALSEIRRRNQELQRKLITLESALAEFGYSDRKVAFQTTEKLIFKSILIDTLDDDIKYVQKIGAPLKNVSAVALCFPYSGRDLDGEMHIRVATEYSEEAICDVVLPLAQIESGWVEFGCVPTANGRAEPLHLDVTFRGTDRGSIFPALASGFSAEQHHLSRDGVSLGHPLALRVFSSSPGLAGGRRTVSHVGKILEQTRLLPNDTLAGATNYRFSHQTPSFNVVEYSTQHQSLLVHPLSAEPVVAELRHVRVPNNCFINSIIEHRNNDGTPVEFGLYVVESKDPDPVFSGLEGRAIVNCINWSRLNGGEWAEIQTPFSAVEAGAGEKLVNVYFLTRSFHPQPHLAWSVFRQLSITKFAV